MKEKIKKAIAFVHFYIGVNVIGIPDIHTHDISTFWYKKTTSNFF